MSWISTLYICLNIVYWMLLFFASRAKKPGTNPVTWTIKEIKFFRGLSLALVVIGVMALLPGCGGGDAPDDRKNDPSPNCAMRPETCA